MRIRDHFVAFVVCVLVFGVVLALPQTAHYRANRGVSLPDRSATPGAVNGAAVADASGREHLIGGVELNLCARDFRATAIRKKIKNFAKLKREACEEYGVKKCDAHVEGDHLVSIEIGGCPDCLTNLWPQPMDQARVKDHEVEDALPKLICAGKISLEDAQRCIAKDWVACAARVKKLEGSER